MDIKSTARSETEAARLGGKRGERAEHRIHALNVNALGGVEGSAGQRMRCLRRALTTPPENAMHSKAKYSSRVRVFFSS